MKARKGQSNNKKATYEERILNALNLIMRQQLTDVRFSSATLTKVDLNNDFSMAHIFWDCFDQEKREGVARAFESASNKMRTLLAQSLKVRAVPEIKFSYDSQYEDESRITDLLNEESKSGKTF